MNTIHLLGRSEQFACNRERWGENENIAKMYLAEMTTQFVNELKSDCDPHVYFLSKTQATASQLKLLAAKKKESQPTTSSSVDGSSSAALWWFQCKTRFLSFWNEIADCSVGGLYRLRVQLRLKLTSFINSTQRWGINCVQQIYVWLCNWQSPQLCHSLSLFSLRRLIVRDPSWLRHHVLLLCIDGLCPKLIFVFGDRSWTIVKKM